MKKILTLLTIIMFVSLYVFSCKAVTSPSDGGTNLSTTTSTYGTTTTTFLGNDKFKATFYKDGSFTTVTNSSFGIKWDSSYNNWGMIGYTSWGSNLIILMDYISTGNYYGSSTDLDVAIGYTYSSTSWTSYYSYGYNSINIFQFGNSVGNIVKGTFSGILYTSSGSTNYTITNGYFEGVITTAKSQQSKSYKSIKEDDFLEFTIEIFNKELNFFKNQF